MRNGFKKSRSQATQTGIFSWGLVACDISIVSVNSHICFFDSNRALLLGNMVPLLRIRILKCLRAKSVYSRAYMLSSTFSKSNTQGFPHICG